MPTPGHSYPKQLKAKMGKKLFEQQRSAGPRRWRQRFFLSKSIRMCSLPGDTRLRLLLIRARPCLIFTQNGSRLKWVKSCLRSREGCREQGDVGSKTT